MTPPGGVAVPTPIEGGAADAAERFDTRPITVPEALLDGVREGGGTVWTGTAERAEAGRDWWPLAIGWAAAGQVPARPAAVVRPISTDQVSQILAGCSDNRVPVTPMGGRSGVCGGSVALFGGVALDLTGLAGEVVVDEESLVAEVPAGTFGPDLERSLRSTGTAGCTLGHWPQSMDLSTVGGWIACRGAGQYSTRYGKIEDMVAGLEVVLADGRVVRTGQAPRSATGPDLTQLFVGSEGTLGVVTRAWLRVRPAPASEGRRAFGFERFPDGLAACRRVLRRGATPAVLRLYDRTESERSFDRSDRCVLIVLDEADPGLLEATLAVVDEECALADRLDDALVGRWQEQRNDVSALEPLWRAGVVVDTAEVAGRWSVLPALAEQVVEKLRRLDGTLAASVHQSHAYPDGACLYFTFAGSRPAGGDGDDETGTTWAEAYYRRAWDTLTAVVCSHGAAISHHHGIGLNRGRFLPGSLGEAFGVLAAVKRALDPAGILNPGKLGLASPFGEVPWP